MLYIDCRPLPGQRKYELITSVYIEGVFIEKGFRWNGASIPKALWTAVGSPFQPDFMAPSLVHDYLYKNGYLLGYSREAADSLFKKLLLSNGVNPKKAELMYLAVKAAGFPHYKKS